MRAQRYQREHGSHKKLWVKVLACFGCFVLVIGIIYFVGITIESRGTESTYGNLQERFADDKSIVYNGKEYVYNHLIDSYLFIGVDQRETNTTVSSSARNGGQSDFLLLMVIDPVSKTFRRIQIDRDTMAEITVLGILGNPLGTSTLQICLAHGFGDGREQSCRFTTEAVQRLLCGVPINGYMSLNMDGITALNDLLGGVTVTLEDDFSALDPSMTAGTTLTLRGAQAELFVRSRQQIGSGTNAERMRRQEQYLDKATGMIGSRVKDDSAFVGTLFDGLKDYIITDISRGKMINEANKAAKYQDMGTLTLKGEHTTGSDGFVEFHPDEDALIQMVLDIFYQLRD